MASQACTLNTMIQLPLRRELRAVVPLELPPRQKFLLRDEGLRLRPEERRRRQHDLAVVSADLEEPVLGFLA